MNGTTVWVPLPPMTLHIPVWPSFVSRPGLGQLTAHTSARLDIVVVDCPLQGPFFHLLLLCELIFQHWIREKKKETVCLPISYISFLVKKSLRSLLFWLPPVPHPSLTPTSRVCRSAWTLKRGSIASHSIDPGEPEVPKGWMGWERERERRKKAVTWGQNCHHDTVQLQEANHLTSLFPHLTTGRPTDNY